MSRARRLPRSVNQSPPCLSNTRSFGPFSGCSPHLSTTVSTLPLCRSTRWIEPPIYSAGLRPRHQHVARRNPAEAAIVADVHLAVGAERRAVGAARNFRDHLLAPVGTDPRQPLAADFDQHHRAVGHHHRPFRKFQIGGENANIGHEILPACFGCRRISGSIPHAQHFVARCYGKVDHRLPSNRGQSAPRRAALRAALRHSSCTGIQISSPPLPVAGSNFSS